MIDSLLQKVLKKKSADSHKPAVHIPDEDFIPYVCHYDKNTILTKNGELLQIVRITGFSNTSVVSELVSLRDAVREAVVNHVPDNKVAFWFNTIRRKKNISPKGEFKDFFSHEFNAAWVKENKWDDQYVNELYITIIVEGLDTSIENVQGFLRSFSYLATKSLHRNFLEEAHKKLSAIVNSIVIDTEEYGAKLLGIVDWEGILYSEPMRFFGKIVNLYEERYPLAANDISIDLSSHKIAFGERQLEVLGSQNKNYAAMLSLKEYFEVSTGALDRILQLPCEFIVTQSFDFTFNKRAIESFEYQDYILRISGDEELRQLSGIADFMESNQGKPTDFGKLQTTIMMIGHSRENLEKDIHSAFEQLNALGFVVVREDVFSEHCFWSQLPGNFRYLRRQKIIDAKHIGGFAALHNYPTGLIGGNKWGPAITVLNTILGTPYFFNFHDYDLGHSVAFGSKEFSETTLVNFLVTQARRTGGKLFYLDLNNSAKCLINALGGKYYDFAESDNAAKEYPHLNPLLLSKSKENQAGLTSLFASLVAFAKKPITENEINFIPQIIERIFISKANNFALASEAFNAAETRNIYEGLKIWNSEKLKHIFGSSTEVNWKDDIIAFDITTLLAQKPVLIPVINYLLFQFENSLTGAPAILVLNEAWEILDNPVLGPNLTAFLERMKQKNCAVIFTSKNIDQVGASTLSPVIKQNSATTIVMPQTQPHECLKNIFALTDDELRIAQMMVEEPNDFFFKRAEDAIISTLNLSRLIEFAKIFNADEVTLTAMEEVIAAHSAEKNLQPKDWLPQLFDVLKEIEKEVVAARKQQEREEFLENRRKIKEKMGAE